MVVSLSGIMFKANPSLKANSSEKAVNVSNTRYLVLKIISLAVLIFFGLQNRPISFGVRRVMVVPLFRIWGFSQQNGSLRCF